jgi:hypothetical protein
MLEEFEASGLLDEYRKRIAELNKTLELVIGFMKVARRGSTSFANAEFVDLHALTWTQLKTLIFVSGALATG